MKGNKRGRYFTDEFKRNAVQLVLEKGVPVRTKGLFYAVASLRPFRTRADSFDTANPPRRPEEKNPGTVPCACKVYQLFGEEI